MRHYISLLRTVSLALLVTGLGSIAQAQTFAYVTQIGLHQVSVIDISTNTVVATIPVGATPTAVILSPDGSRAYVTTQGYDPLLGPSYTISVIDTATNTVVATIPGAGRLAISPDGTRLYGLDWHPGVGVEVIDTSTNSVVATIPIPGTVSGSLAVTPDGAHLYIGAAYTGDIFIADTTTNTVVDAISDPAFVNTVGTVSLALSPDGIRLYAGGDLLRTIDTATKTTLALNEPGDVIISLSPDGTKAYLCGFAVDGGPFWVLDTAANTVTPFTDVDGAWVQTAFTPDNAHAYVTDYLNSRVVVFDTASTTVVTTIPLERQSGVRSIAIGTLPPTTPFAGFDVSKLLLNSQGVSEAGNFTLGTSSTQPSASTSLTAGIDPVTQPVTFTIGSYVLAIPAGAFRKDGTNLHWKFIGTLNDVKLNIDIKQHANSTTQFDYMLDAKNGPALTGQPRPIRVSLKIGRNTGSALVP